MRPRYLLCPGLVLSATDGQQHHVGAAALAALYGVPLSECFVLPDAVNHAGRVDRQVLLSRVVRGELVLLRPRHDGDYRLPEAAPC